ncbi:MAG: hypothetical protein MJ252_27390 [archaeon]|nr:hypothetical protein [archaeon]
MDSLPIVTDSKPAPTAFETLPIKTERTSFEGPKSPLSPTEKKEDKNLSNLPHGVFTEIKSEEPPTSGKSGITIEAPAAEKVNTNYFPFVTMSANQYQPLFTVAEQKPKPPERREIKFLPHQALTYNGYFNPLLLEAYNNIIKYFMNIADYKPPLKCLKCGQSDPQLTFYVHKKNITLLYICKDKFCQKRQTIPYQGSDSRRSELERLILHIMCNFLKNHSLNAISYEMSKLNFKIPFPIDSACRQVITILRVVILKFMVNFPEKESFGKGNRILEYSDEIHCSDGNLTTTFLYDYDTESTCYIFGKKEDNACYKKIRAEVEKRGKDIFVEANESEKKQFKDEFDVIYKVISNNYNIIPSKDLLPFLFYEILFKKKCRQKSMDFQIQLLRNVVISYRFDGCESYDTILEKYFKA